MLAKVSLCVAILVQMFLLNSARAACDFRDSTTSHQTIRFAISSVISIKPNTSIGTEIASIPASNGYTVAGECGPGDRYGLRSISGSNAVGDIIPFGDSGLGFNVTSSAIYPRSSSGNVVFRTSAPYVLKIYKIGPVRGPVTIPAGSFAYYAMGSLKMWTASLTNGLVADETGSCELGVSDVHLGEHYASEFSAKGFIGYTTKPVEFSIELRNCSGRINKVTYSMVPGPGWIDWYNGVMRLDSASVSGLGIQITKDKYPVYFGYDYELPGSPSSGDSYIFKAAYFQTERKVGVGWANSSLTVQVSYQ